MKKMLLVLTAFVCMISVSFAQAKKIEKKEKEKVKTIAPVAKPVVASVAKPSTAPAAGPTKKDGTPDMRYKANKEVAPKKKG